MTNSDSKCRYVERALSELPAGGALPEDIREHLCGCAYCRKLAEASSRLEGFSAPSADLLDRVAASMRAELRPVRPLASTARYAILLAGVLLGTLGIASCSMYPYGWEEMGASETILILGGLAFGAIACARLLLKQMTPAGPYHLSPKLLPWLVLGGLALGTTALFGFEREDGFWATSWVCLKIGFGIALPTTALVWLVLRRGVFLSRALAGATAGALAGLVGAGALEVHCPNLNAWHILVSHLGVAVCLGTLAFTAGFIAERGGGYRKFSVHESS